MADPFDTLFDDVGADFSDFCAGQADVTVRQINPDTGATIATANNVTALKRSRRRNPFAVAMGGELGGDRCRFVLRASEVGFVPKARDEITDAAALVWQVEAVEAIGFNQLYACDVTLKRS